MTDSSDIAWMRRLTEEGARAPFRGGVFLLVVGVIYGAASFIQAAIWFQTPDATYPPFSQIWMWATILWLIILPMLIFAMRRGSCGPVSAANRAARAAWSTVGWGIFAMIATIAAYGYKTDAMVALGVIPSVILVFYGMAWAISAVMFRSRNLAIIAAGSFVSAPLVAWLEGTPAQSLVYGLALILFAAIPGFLLMRAARAARVNVAEDRATQDGATQDGAV